MEVLSRKKADDASEIHHLRGHLAITLDALQHSVVRPLRDNVAFIRSHSSLPTNAGRNKLRGKSGRLQHNIVSVCRHQHQITHLTRRCSEPLAAQRSTFR